MENMMIPPPPEMLTKANEAVLRSNFWEFAEKTLNLELALASANYDGEPGPKRVRKVAKAMLPQISDVIMRKFVSEISTSNKTVDKLKALVEYRDSLILKVAVEFTEAERFGDVGEYRRQRIGRITQEAA